MSEASTRFARWLRLCPPQTRYLASLVRQQLLPVVESMGFERVAVDLRDPGSPVSGSVIELERWTAEHVDSICFNFDKYRAPRLQVHGSRRSATVPHPFLRSGNLVARPAQYLHFWGKPWWLPAAFWSERACERSIDRLAGGLPELCRFLRTGERSRHISRDTG